jgi:hypothetical protein
MLWSKADVALCPGNDTRRPGGDTNASDPAFVVSGLAHWRERAGLSTAEVAAAGLTRSMIDWNVGWFEHWQRCIDWTHDSPPMAIAIDPYSGPAIDQELDDIGERFGLQAVGGDDYDGTFLATAAQKRLLDKAGYSYLSAGDYGFRDPLDPPSAVPGRRSRTA